MHDTTNTNNSTPALKRRRATTAIFYMEDGEKRWLSGYSLRAYTASVDSVHSKDGAQLFTPPKAEQLCKELNSRFLRTTYKTEVIR